MKNFKSSFFVILFCALGVTSQAQFTFGAGATLNLEGSTYIGLLGRAQYQITPEIAAAADFTYWLEDFVNYSININGYYNVLTLGESIELSPMAGLNITSFDLGSFGSTSNTAIQIGALFEIPVGGMDLGIEPKLVLDSGSGFQVSGFVMFGGGDD